MSKEELDQRDQEAKFYYDLFVRSGTWSTPNPNTDESMRWEKIKRFLPEIIQRLHQIHQTPIRILDVGCGRGWLTNLLSEYGKCEGIEPVETVIEYGRTLFPNLVLHAGFPEELLTRDNFQPYDLIVTSEVIEHIPHAQKANFVHILQQLLKPDGAVILSTPRREVWDQWRAVSTPNQPIEDWITEPDLLNLFQEKGFYELGRERIYFDLQKFQYVTPPSGVGAVDPSILPLYQVWAFGIGIHCQERADHVGCPPSLQSLPFENEHFSGNGHAVSPVLSKTSEESSHSPNPLVSVIVPTFSRRSTLKVALQSIFQQTFTDYEVIVINDAGEDVEDVVAPFNLRNNVTSIRHGRNRGLAAARNSGLGVARGKYIAYLDDDDRFLPNHLETLVNYLEESSCQVAYSDAWRVWQIQANGHYVEKNRDVPYSKDFNPETLLITNFFPVLCVMHEKDCLGKTGLFDETLTTHEDWDLWIRLSRHYPFAHIKEITAEFTWRTDGSSMTSCISEDFLRTIRLIYQKYDDYFRLQPHLIPIRDQRLREMENRADPQAFTCSIIIPVFNRADLTKQCLTMLAALTVNVHYEVIVIDNASTDGTQEFLSSLEGDIQIIRNETNLGFAKACNQGARVAKAKYLVFLNNDTIPNPSWLEPLIYEVDSHKDVAVVGSKLLYPNNTIQHAGVVFSRDFQLPYHIFNGVPENWPAVNSRKEFQAVTAACMLVRKEIFEAVGGFDEAFVNGFEDVDFCLKIRQIRKKVVYQPKSCLYHLESQTPGRKKQDDLNAQRLATRWKHQWLADEDIIAYESGLIIQYNFSDEQLKTQLIPKNDVTHPGSWQKVVDLEQLLFQQKRLPLAEMTGGQKVRDLLVDVEGWPNDIGILVWVGDVCEKLKLEQEAVQFWQKLLTIGDHPHARLGLARAMLKNGNLDEAQSHLEKFTRRFPPRVEGWSLQGILSMQRQEFSEAKQAFEEALAIDGANRRARKGLGMACLGLGETDEAWSIFEQVVSVDPDDIEAMRCLIQTGTALQQWEDLASHLSRYIERNPADCDMRFALAGVQFRAGYPEKAKEHLTWLRLIKPDYEGLDDLEGLLHDAQTSGDLVPAR